MEIHPKIKNFRGALSTDIQQGATNTCLPTKRPPASSCFQDQEPRSKLLPKQNHDSLFFCANLQEWRSLSFKRSLLRISTNNTFNSDSDFQSNKVEGWALNSRQRWFQAVGDVFNFQ